MTGLPKIHKEEMRISLGVDYTTTLGYRAAKSFVTIINENVDIIS